MADDREAGLFPDLKAAPSRSRWEIQTQHQYDFGEVASALQKCIRRGWTDEALFWAMELNESGYGAYCWRRLMVIASEDVGLGDPNCVVQLAALHYASEVVRSGGSYAKKGSPWPEEHLLQAVMVLSRANKNREANDAYLAIKLRMERDQLLRIPEVALDKHTKRGRKAGKGWKDFELEGRVVVPEVKVDGDPWHQRWVEESGIAEGRFKGFHDD